MAETKTASRRLVAFPYYGGKNSKLGFLLPLLPNSERYCEVFGGSAAVLLNREKSREEVFNDINGEVVNFFRVLREQPERLLEMLRLTPYARAEFVGALEQPEDAVEQARRFYVFTRQVRGAHGPYGPTAWRAAAGIGNTWVVSMEGLMEVAARLRSVTFDCDDAFRVIQRYDSPEALFYVDPPYIEGSGDGKAYRTAFTLGHHVALANLLHGIKGKAAVSGYAGLYDQLYADWERHADVPKVATIGSDEGAIKQEVCWTSYRVPDGGFRAAESGEGGKEGDG